MPNYIAGHAVTLITTPAATITETFTSKLAKDHERKYAEHTI